MNDKEVIIVHGTGWLSSQKHLTKTKFFQFSLRKILCKLGLHKYIKREIHVVEKITNSVHFHNGIATVIIKRCSCGEAKVVLGEMKTITVVPEKFSYDKTKFNKLRR